DSAIIRSQIRIRFDAAYDDNRPDRAEFFYGKCGCFRSAGDPHAPGPPLPETRLDYQEMMGYVGLAASPPFTGFLEMPVRFVNPERNDNTSGVGDLNFGIRTGLVAEPGRFWTFQFRTFVPTGNASQGLGTNHVSLEPALLAFESLTDRAFIQA